MISLATRPVLFAIVRALAEAWPGDVARDTLMARAFGRNSLTNLIARDCASKSDGFAGCLAHWPASAQRSEGLR